MSKIPNFCLRIFGREFLHDYFKVVKFVQINDYFLRLIRGGSQVGFFMYTETQRHRDFLTKNEIRFEPCEDFF